MLSATETPMEQYANMKTQGWNARGAGWIVGADQYYFFSKILYGDGTYFVHPEKVASEAGPFWMSGMMRWMIPLDNRPAPHNIILGQWEPTEAEAEKGLIDGFGAVSALLFGADQCGMKGHPIATARTEIYEEIIKLLSGVDDNTDDPTKTGTAWEAKDTIFTFEKSSCEDSAKAAFPQDGDYAAMPMFASKSLTTDNWAIDATAVETPGATIVLNGD